MEITLNQKNKNNLIALIELTISEDEQKKIEAENYLQALENKRNFLVLLMMVVEDDEVEERSKVLTTKRLYNFVKKNWDSEIINEAKKTYIKEKIVQFLKINSEILKQEVLKVILLIGAHDFPLKWPNLLDQIKPLGIPIIAHNRPILSMFEPVLHRVVGLSVTEEIEQSITDITDFTVQIAKEILMNPVDDNSTSFEVEGFVCNTFSCLSKRGICQKGLDGLMSLFIQTLCESKALLSSGEAAVYFRKKRSTLSILTRLATNHHKEFAPYLSVFVTTIWGMLVNENHSKEVLIDSQVFLWAVAENENKFPPISSLKEIYEICQIFSKTLIEDFENKESKQCNLVQSFEKQCSKIFSQKLVKLLQTYATDPQAFATFKEKAVAKFLALATEIINKDKARSQNINLDTQQKNLLTQTEKIKKKIIDLKNSILEAEKALKINIQEIYRAEEIEIENLLQEKHAEELKQHLAVCNMTIGTMDDIAQQVVDDCSKENVKKMKDMIYSLATSPERYDAIALYFYTRLTLEKNTDNAIKIIYLWHDVLFHASHKNLALYSSLAKFAIPIYGGVYEKCTSHNLEKMLKMLQEPIDSLKIHKSEMMTKYAGTLKDIKKLTGMKEMIVYASTRDLIDYFSLLIVNEQHNLSLLQGPNIIPNSKKYFIDRIAHSVAVYGHTYEQFLKEANCNNSLYSFINKEGDTDYLYYKMRIEFEIQKLKKDYEPNDPSDLELTSSPTLMASTSPCNREYHQLSQQSLPLQIFIGNYFAQSVNNPSFIQGYSDIISAEVDETNNE